MLRHAVSKRTITDEHLISGFRRQKLHFRFRILEIFKFFLFSQIRILEMHLSTLEIEHLILNMCILDPRHASHAQR
jgi:hypothetical protein